MLHPKTPPTPPALSRGTELISLQVGTFLNQIPTTRLLTLSTIIPVGYWSTVREPSERKVVLKHRAYLAVSVLQVDLSEGCRHQARAGTQWSPIGPRGPVARILHGAPCRLCKPKLIPQGHLQPLHLLE